VNSENFSKIRSMLCELEEDTESRDIDNLCFNFSPFELWVTAYGFDAGNAVQIDCGDNEDFRRFDIYDSLMKVREDWEDEEGVEVLKDGAKMLRKIADAWDKKAEELNLTGE